MFVEGFVGNKPVNLLILFYIKTFCFVIIRFMSSFAISLTKMGKKSGWRLVVLPGTSKLT